MGDCGFRPVQAFHLLSSRVQRTEHTKIMINDYFYVSRDMCGQHGRSVIAATPFLGDRGSAD